MAAFPASQPSDGGAASSPSVADRLRTQAENERLAAEQNRFAARGQVDLARQAEAGGDQNEALRDYTKAAELDPSNADAAAGKQRMLEAAGKAPPAGGMPGFTVRQSLAIQQIKSQFNAAIASATAATKANDFAGAQQAIEQARVARAADPGAFPVEQLRQMDDAIARADQDLQSQRAAYDRANREKTDQEIQQREEARVRQAREERDRTVANLIRLARQDVDGGKYMAALGVLDQILVLDPHNDYALGVRPLVEDKSILQQQRGYREEFDRELGRAAERGRGEADPVRRHPPVSDQLAGHQRGARREVKSERGG